MPSLVGSEMCIRDRVFGDILRDLLLAAPAGQRAVIGLDPGIRTGVKVAVVDSTGTVSYTHLTLPTICSV